MGPSVAIAIPVYTASGESSIFFIAAVPPFHPEITPSSPAKMNRAGFPLGSLKPVPTVKYLA
jgi:hypothetical protein